MVSVICGSGGSFRPEFRLRAVWCLGACDLVFACCFGFLCVGVRQISYCLDVGFLLRTFIMFMLGCLAGIGVLWVFCGDSWVWFGWWVCFLDCYTWFLCSG